MPAQETICHATAEPCQGYAWPVLRTVDDQKRGRNGRETRKAASLDFDEDVEAQLVAKAAAMRAPYALHSSGLH